MSLKWLPPPSTCLHPLLVLDEYAKSLKRKPNRNELATTTDAATTALAMNSNTSDEIDEILRVADCLFGRMLDGALMILDAGSSMPSSTLSPTFRFTSTRSHTLTSQHQSVNHLITKVVSSTSQRTLYFVKGSSSSSTSSRKSRGDTVPEYLCLLPHESKVSSQCQKGIYYCSCRSFYEKRRFRGTTSREAGACNEGTEVHPTNDTLCKHLLAIKLLSIFSSATSNANITVGQATLVETVSDTDFAKLVVDRLAIDY